MNMIINKKACPFFSSAMMVVGELGNQKTGVAEVPCIGDRCMIWNNDLKDCNVNVIADSLIKLKSEEISNGKVS